MTRHLLLIVASILAFALAAILSFGWFGTNADPGDVLGIGFVGLGLFAGAHL